VTDWQVVWLGVIGVAVVVMAGVQIGLIVVSLRLARQLSETAEEVRREIRPLVEKIHRVAEDVSKVATLAAVQIERLDHAFSATSTGFDDAASIVRHAMGGPVRKGYAAFLAMRAVMSAFRDRRHRDQVRRDEEDALFVG
jgi:hypothetical protein